jgi:hypothetical protein
MNAKENYSMGENRAIPVPESGGSNASSGGFFNEPPRSTLDRTMGYKET